MTPHINAQEEAFSDLVLMPGDPKRAQFIAETYLENYKQITDVRGILGYTGYYKNRKVSVMASGMGIPSIGIYAYELYQFYHVKTIIRIGTCGSNDKEYSVFDVVLAKESDTMSNFAQEFANEECKVAYPSLEVNNAILKTAASCNLACKEESIFTSEAFYHIHNNRQNFKLVEMESFALFYIASKLGKQAAALFTVSDSFVTKEETTSEEREKHLNEMIVLALESALNIK